MENVDFFEQGIEELEMDELGLDELEQVTGGKKRPFVKATGNNVNVRKGPGTEYGVVAQLGNHDEVAVISKKIVRDGKCYYWAKVKVAVSQSKYVEGWVCSKYAKGVWR